jgi:YjbE family integral membrane protein
MQLDGSFNTFGIPLKVFYVDLLLSGDNALLIAMACRSLAPNVMRKTMLLGTCAAVALRFILALMVGVLLLIPCLKLIGAMGLLIIAIKLIVGDDHPDDVDGVKTATGELWTAMKIIIVADVVMSLDNIVALAAVAQGNWGYLALGLALSIPVVIYGSLFVSRILKQYPILITGGGALLAWIAGDLAVSDPMISNWVDTKAFAWHVAVPFSAAIFTLLHSRIIVEQRRAAPTTDTW